MKPQYKAIIVSEVMLALIFLPTLRMGVTPLEYIQLLFLSLFVMSAVIYMVELGTNQSK